MGRSLSFVDFQRSLDIVYINTIDQFVIMKRGVEQRIFRYLYFFCTFFKQYQKESIYKLEWCNCTLLV